jgi:hypothetical protein
MSNRLTIIVLKTASFFFITIGLNAQQPDFTGTWTRNTDKCDAGGLSMNSVPVKLSVKQDPGQIEIRRISKSAMGDTTNYTEKIKFDGTTAFSVIRPNFNKKATIQWSTDQKGFIEQAAYMDDLNNPKQTAHEIWTYDEDGKSLKIQLTITLNGADHTLTEIFDKQ